MTQLIHDLYVYSAKILRVINDDKVDLLIDLGLGIFVEKQMAIQAKEGVFYERSKAATEYLHELVASHGGECVIRTHQGKQGILSCEIHFESGALYELLIAAGLAKG